MTTLDPRLDQHLFDAHAVHVEPGQTTPQARQMPLPKSVPPAGSHTPPPANLPATSTPPPPVVDPLLFIHATMHHDLEQQRIASQNRLRILTTEEPDDDGVIRGFGLDDSYPDVARLRGITDALFQLEHDAELGLTRALRRCAIHPWVKAQVGLGDKQVARLLGAIGDPYWNATDARPRTVSELWAYCGYKPGQRRRKGEQANWSPEAKKRAYLVATSCVKHARSPYRSTYVARRAHTAETHTEWEPGHSHNDALRITSKAVLRDLWREARRLHGVSP